MLLQFPISEGRVQSRGPWDKDLLVEDKGSEGRGRTGSAARLEP